MTDVLELFSQYEQEQDESQEVKPKIVKRDVEEKEFSFKDSLGWIFASIELGFILAMLFLGR